MASFRKRSWLHLFISREWLLNRDNWKTDVENSWTIFYQECSSCRHRNLERCKNLVLKSWIQVSSFRRAQIKTNVFFVGVGEELLDDELWHSMARSLTIDIVPLHVVIMISGINHLLIKSNAWSFCALFHYYAALRCCPFHLLLGLILLSYANLSLSKTVTTFIRIYAFRTASLLVVSVLMYIFVVLLATYAIGKEVEVENEHSTLKVKGKILTQH